MHGAGPTWPDGPVGGPGVFKTTDGGTSWAPSNAGLSATSVKSVAVDPVATTTMYAGTVGAGAFKSVDAGASWTPINVGLTSADISAIAVAPGVSSTLYAATGHLHGAAAGVFKSIDAEPAGAR